MVGPKRVGFALRAICLVSSLSVYTWAQVSAAHLEVGVVYYADGDGFSPLEKEELSGGWGGSTYTEWARGGHATVRLSATQSPTFRVCDIDPTDFKLYTFRAEGRKRSITVEKLWWMGETRSVLKDAEVPLNFTTAGSGCFAITPRNALQDGEYGFGRAFANEAFMFGIGEVSQQKRK